MPVKRRTRRKNIRHSKTRRIRQKAGGESATYCVACGKPLSNWGIDIDSKETDWMNKNIGFDSEHNLIVNLNGDDDLLGMFAVSNKQLRSTNARLYELEEEGLDITEFSADHIDIGSITDLYGLVLHRDCVNVMKLFGLNVNFELVHKLHESCTSNKKYQDQFYEWDKALSEDESNYMSPLASKVQRMKLMEGCSEIKEVRNAPSKEKERRQRVINATRFANASRKMKLPINVKSIISSYLINTRKNVRRTDTIKPEEILNVYEENNSNNNSNKNNNNNNNNNNNEIEPAGGAGRRLSI